MAADREVLAFGDDSVVYPVICHHGQSVAACLDLGCQEFGRRVEVLRAAVCPHDQPLAVCSAPDCQETKRLAGEDPDRLLGLRSRAPAEVHRRPRLVRDDLAEGDTITRFKEGDEASAFKLWKEGKESDPEREMEAREEPEATDFREVFPNLLSVRAAVQHGAITARQGEIVNAYLRPPRPAVADPAPPVWEDMGRAYAVPDPDPHVWEEVGRACGVSPKTVRRELTRVAQRVGVGAPLAAEPPSSRWRRIRDRGARGVKVYRRHQVRFGAWTQTWWERVTEAKKVAQAKREALDTIHATPITSSRMDDLAGALLEALVGREAKTPFEAADRRISTVTWLRAGCPGVGFPVTRPPEPYEAIHRSPDWRRNLERARRRLHRRTSPPPWTTRDVWAAGIPRRAPRCRSCHSPILVGFWLDGQRVTRRREFCDEACKKRTKRVRVGARRPARSAASSAVASRALRPRAESTALRSPA